MPALVRLYIRNVIIGFGLSVIFVGALLWHNVANLWHLISTSPQGWIAVLMLFVFNGIVFAAVQFAIAVMRMADGGGQNGGKGARMIAAVLPVPAARHVGTPKSHQRPAP